MKYKFVKLPNKIKQKLFLRSKKLSRKHLYEFIDKSLEEEVNKSINKKVLNIGAGGEIGKHVKKICNKYKAKLMSIDIDKNREPDIICDVKNMPFKNNNFDIIVCAEILEHVLFPHESINEMHRVLKQNGALILTTRFIFPLHDVPYDYFRYTKYGIKELLNSFKEVIVKEQLNWIETIATLKIRLLRENKSWINIFAIPIYINAKIKEFIAQLFIKLLPTDYMTSGYLVLARK